MSAGSGPSTPESIAATLRENLLDGAIGPGARLTEESLTERFGSGRHSVRSALQILVSEGLLEHRLEVAQLGAVLFEVRFLVDCLDGKVARARGLTSARGAAFDLATDVVTITLAYSAIAV